ncbi:MAG TPA: sulfotransferase [Rhizomicrobium sp.]|jgi:tetratricopeptide (TPR) repeat protein|nr:sulfotransferase [Rhizomicrobium sp.]
MAAEAARLGQFDDADRLLSDCLAIAPRFVEARERHAMLLLDRLDLPARALEQTEILLRENPTHAGYRAIRAAVLGLLGDYAGAIADYEDVLARQPADARSWLRYGHMLKTVGRQDDAVAAYRKAIALKPGNGEAYWSLADLKTVRLSAGDIWAMRSALQSAGTSDKDRIHLHFALGKALEDDGDFPAAFLQFDLGNSSRRASLRYDANEMRACVQQAKAIFTPDFFARREGHGCDAPDAIFVVGLPRSGSTLVEQILASHSTVEGTMELPDMIAVSRKIGADAAGYPSGLAALPPSRFKALGEEYLERTRAYRRTGRPLFIDKLSNNFILTALIHLMLPRAKIIDVRRHPMACCVSAFKQNFAGGQNFTFDLTDVGRFYADYVALMAHYDAVLPGRVHRVFYENLVGDTEGEIRRLLDHCGLPFEPACLRFHDNGRAVRTSSSQQVRRPISSADMASWRNFAPWLEPLQNALGPVLDAYPAAPGEGPA